VAGASEASADSLYDFGINAGLAFQIQDDLLDAFGDPEKVGKKPGGDILQDKKTLLMIYTRQLAAKDLEFLQSQDLKGEAKVKAFGDLIIKSGARAKAEAKRDHLMQTALADLEAAHGSDEALKAELAQFAQWLSHRDR